MHQQMESWHDCWWDRSQNQVLPILNWDCAVHPMAPVSELAMRSSFCSLLLLVRAFVRAAATSSVMWLPIRSSFSNTELGFCNSSQKRACQLAVVMCCKLQTKSTLLACCCWWQHLLEQLLPHHWWNCNSDQASPIYREGPEWLKAGTPLAIVTSLIHTTRSKVLSVAVLCRITFDNDSLVASLMFSEIKMSSSNNLHFGSICRAVKIVSQRTWAMSGAQPISSSLSGAFWIMPFVDRHAFIRELFFIVIVEGHHYIGELVIIKRLFVEYHFSTNGGVIVLILSMFVDLIHLLDICKVRVERWCKNSVQCWKQQSDSFEEEGPLWLRVCVCV